MPLLLFALAPLLLQSWPVPDQNQPKENGQWLCWAYSGKRDEARPIRESHPLAWYAENLPAFDPEIKWRVEHQAAWKGITAEVVPVGRISGHDALDIFFKLKGYPEPFGKMLLIGDDERYRPVAWILADAEVLFVNSRIVTVSDTRILYTRYRITGTGNFYYEDYFVFDESQGVPVNLAVQSKTSAELRRILPSGCGVWKGGGFDPASLKFSSAVWRDGDANCCPTAGKVEIDFAIQNGKLIVVNSTYDPNFKDR